MIFSKTEMTESTPKASDAVSTAESNRAPSDGTAGRDEPRGARREPREPMTAGYVTEELRRLCAEKQTGTLELSGGEGERIVVSLFEGMIDGVSSNIHGQRLGDYLGQDAALTSKDLDALAAHASKESIVLGKAAVEQKAADAAHVAVAVRSQSLELIGRAIRKSFAVGEFKPRLKSFEISGRVGFPVVEIELSREQSAPFDAPDDVRLRIVEGADLSSYPWIPEELGVLSALAEPRTIGEIVESLRLPEATLRKILGVLDRIGVIEIAGEALSVSGSDEAQHSSGSPNGALVRSRDFPFENLIPTVPSDGFEDRLRAARESSSFTSEQFKNLKVQLADHEAAERIFTVSSPEAQDGKSFVAVNLALSYAMDPDRRVLLIDCDLRRPAVGRYLGVGEDPGLLQYLESARLSPFCFLRRVEGLYFMAAGGTTPRPIEILSMGKTKEMFERFRGVFDTIILDAPPYSPIADARIVTGLSDGLIMVVRRGKTHCSAADRAFNAIDPKKLIGVVFNDVKPMLFNSPTYGGYGYSYGKYEYGNSPALTIKPSESRSRPRKYLE